MVKSLCQTGEHHKDTDDHTGVIVIIIRFLLNLRLPRKAVTSSGAELPAAINVAPATSCDNPRPERGPK